MDPLLRLNLPPGFRFYPTDEELMLHYLRRKVAGFRFPLQIIGDIDLYKFDAWVLPGKALFGDKEWYFFTPRDRKYPNGSRPNRLAGSGYWKATGTDKVIKTDGRTVGVKKALVFYVGKAPKGDKTNWIMHEYRLSQSSPTRPGGARLDDWVLCRIYKKNSGVEKAAGSAGSGERSFGGSSLSMFDVHDVLGLIPETDGGFFSLTGMNYNQLQEQRNQDPAGESFGSGGLGWSALNGLINGPVGMGQARDQIQGQFMGGHVISVGSGTCGNYIPPPRSVGSPQEVQSGVNPLGEFVGQGYSDPADPFGFGL